MGPLVKTSFAAAVLGGAVTAAVLVSSGVVDGGMTTTVIQQAPLSRMAAADAPQTVSDSSEAGGLTAREIYRRDAPGVVFVRAQVVKRSQSPFDLFGSAEPGEATGAGFVVDDKGYLLTNAHVIASSTAVTVSFSDHRTRPAQVVGKDSDNDLALLKVDPRGLDLHPLELGDSGSVQVGDPTIAIGNPFGYEQTLTTGVVSALQRLIQAPSGASIADVIQTDASINPGNSGGPLIDAAGRVIGINSQIATGAGGESVGIGFAIPVNTAKAVLPELRKSGRVRRAWLGVTGVDVDGTLEAIRLPLRHGVLIQDVEPGGPAARAGVRGGDRRARLGDDELVLGGDLLERFDGKPIRNMSDLRAAITASKPGKRVRIELLRGTQRRTFELELGDRPPLHASE